MVQEDETPENIGTENPDPDGPETEEPDKGGSDAEDPATEDQDVEEDDDPAGGPSIDVDLLVYHGASDEVLLKGAGHLQGTSFPVGGISNRSVTFAHRGLATATMFDDLDKLRSARGL